MIFSDTFTHGGSVSKLSDAEVNKTVPCRKKVCVQQKVDIRACYTK